MNAAFQLLTHRLEWPVARVRCEAAYQLAQAITEGAPGAADALLAWTAGRQLESEAALGVSIIDAFELAPCFDVDVVVAAVRAPSHLSDLLIRRNFPTAKNLFPFRYNYARSGIPVESVHRDYFNYGIGQFIARRFRTVLLGLQKISDLPFLEHWLEEWNGLQQSLDAPFSGRPDYVWSDAPRENIASVQVRQSELYVSAYLRTLAYAAAEWRMPVKVADEAALEAIPLSRGLAGVRPVARPNWSFASLKTRERRGLHASAQAAWRRAERDVGAGRKLLALRTTDHSETEFLAYRFRQVLVPSGATPPAPSDEFERVPWAIVTDTAAAMVGPLEQVGAAHSDPNRFLSVHVQPTDFPRFLIDHFPSALTQR